MLSDNGPQMTSHTTRDFMAYAWLAAHYGRRSGTPTDQAWIESLFGHVKHEHPHLERISDIAVLRAELDTVAHHYNEVRLHAGIGSPSHPANNTEAKAKPSDKHDTTDSNTHDANGSPTIRRNPKPCHQLRVETTPKSGHRTTLTHLSAG